MSSAFISYSRDNDAHTQWARALAARLNADGIPTTIDKGISAMTPAQVAEVMEAAVLAHTYVLVICTPKYRERSDLPGGPDGYSGDVMTPAIKTSGNQRKFIPILRLGEWAQAGPLWLSEHYIDMRDGPRREQAYQDLLATLQGTKGRMSQAAAVAPPPAPTGPPAKQEEPPKIIGVIMEEVGEPRNDGSFMSRWHRVPLKLSKPVDLTWENTFERAWNTSTKFANVRRTSIAKVNYDRIVMSCTTLDEVLNDHRMDLVQCVIETNRIVAEKAAARKAAEEAHEKAAEAHRKHLAELAERARFE